MKLFAVTALCAALLSGAAANAGSEAKPIATVIRHGGLCVTGSECRTTLRITDTTVSGQGLVPRRLKPGERAALLRAIRKLDFAAIRSRPFTGTCPVAYDGTESIYRFRGFSRPLASCTYDLKGVQAVRLTERLLATLKPR